MANRSARKHWKLVAVPMAQACVDVGLRWLVRLTFRSTPLYRKAVDRLRFFAGGPEDDRGFLNLVLGQDRWGMGIWRLVRAMKRHRDEALRLPPQLTRLPRDYRHLLAAYCRSPWYPRLLRRWVVPVYTAAIAATVGYSVLTVSRHMYKRGLGMDWNWAAYAFTRTVLLLAQMDELLRSWLAETPMDRGLHEGFHRMILASGHVTGTLRHAAATCRHVLNRTRSAPDPLLAHRSLLRTSVLAADFLFAISGMKALLSAGGAESGYEEDLPAPVGRMPVMFPRLHTALARWYAPPSLGGKARPAKIYLPTRGRTPYWEHPDIEQAIDGARSFLEEMPERLRGYQALLLNDVDIEDVIRRLVPGSAQSSFDVLVQFTSDLLDFGHAVWRLQSLTRKVASAAFENASGESFVMARDDAIRMLWGEVGAATSDELVRAALSLLSMAPPVGEELDDLWRIVEDGRSSPSIRWAAFVTFARLSRYEVEKPREPTPVVQLEPTAA